MIYKPNAVSPNFEVVPVKDDTASFTLKIKGVSSPKLFNRARIYLKQGNVERTYYKDIDKIDSGSGAYEINLDLKRVGEIDTEEEIYTIDLNYKPDIYNENGELTGTKHSNAELDIRVNDEKAIIINNRQPIIWKVRLYEDKSIQEEYDEVGNYIGYYNIGSLRSLMGVSANSNPKTWDKYYRNMRPIIAGGTMITSDSIKIDPEKVVFPEKNTICKSYTPTNKIAYGTIQNICSKKNKSHTSNDITHSKRFYQLKIYPHDIVNQFSYGNPFYDTSGTLIVNGVKKTNKYGTYNYFTSKRELSKNSDSKYARYYIKIGDTYYNILDFRYYDWITENSNMYTDHNKDDDTLDDKYYYEKGGAYFDTYGNPLALYILISVDLEVRENGYVVENEYTEILNECEGMDYSIYCNYIDTDQYSFELSTIPSIDFRDVNNENLKVFDSKEDAINKTLGISYSNFKINGELIQPCDTYISEYSSHLYIIKNGVEQLIDEKAGVYSQKYSYEFNELRNRENYLLVIKIVDNNGNVTEKYLCISPNYGQPSSLITANVTFDYQRKCNIVDFGDVIDISPDETVKGAHKFYQYSDQTSNKYLHIDSGNSLVYNKKDNEYGKLNIPDESLINIVVKNDYYNTGQICQMITNGGYIMSLYWNGIQYEYTVEKDGIMTKYLYYPYDKDIDNITYTMRANMAEPDLSVETPYIWTDDYISSEFDNYISSEFKDADYVHVETPADMYWHSIIFNREGIKFMRLGDEEFTKWIAGEKVTE